MKQLSADEGFDIVYGDNEDYASVAPETIVGKRRWTIEIEQVFQRKSDNTFWLISWERGATEQQDYCEPEFRIIQVVPVSKMITVYEPIQEPAND